MTRKNKKQTINTAAVKQDIGTYFGQSLKSIVSKLRTVCHFQSAVNNIHTHDV